jgi:hypothetical protein
MTEEKQQASQSKTKRLVSPSQVAGGALASVTAAYLGSHLGVAGTFWGAGLSSVVVSVGGAVYQRSLERTRARASLAAARTALTRAKSQSLALRQLNGKPGEHTVARTKLSAEELGRLRRARSPQAVAPVTADPSQQETYKFRPLPNAVLPGMHWPAGEPVVDPPQDTDSSQPTVRIEHDEALAEPAQPSDPAPSTKLVSKRTLLTVPSKRIRWVVVAATSTIVFVVCVLLITGFEEITGKPLSGGQRGTSLGQVFHPSPPVTPTTQEQPVIRTHHQRPSEVATPTTTVQPTPPPSVQPSQTPRLLPPATSSQQPTPTTTSVPTTTTTTQQPPSSTTLLPGL